MSKEVQQTQQTGIISSMETFEPQSMKELFAMCSLFCKTNFVPASYKNKPEESFVAALMGRNLGLDPLQSLQNIAVINGRPSIWGDGLKAVVMSKPDFEDIEELFDDETMTAICKVKRKNMSWQTRTFSMEDAKQAGLTNSPTYKKYPKRMLANRARSFALRDVFPHHLSGIITVEEAEETEPEVIKTEMEETFENMAKTIVVDAEDKTTKPKSLDEITKNGVDLS